MCLYNNGAKIHKKLTICKSVNINHEAFDLDKDDKRKVRETL